MLHARFRQCHHSCRACSDDKHYHNSSRSEEHSCLHHGAAAVSCTSRPRLEAHRSPPLSAALPALHRSPPLTCSTALNKHDSLFAGAQNSRHCVYCDWLQLLFSALRQSVVRHCQASGQWFSLKGQLLMQRPLLHVHERLAAGSESLPESESCMQVTRMGRISRE